MGEGGPRSANGDNIRRLPSDRGDSRTRHPSAARSAIPPERDPLGKMALFSTAGSRRAMGTFLVDCSSCRRETPVNPVDLVRSALPLSVHLPFVRKYHSFMRCPACGRRTWVRIAWQP
jgi:uncharacterized protein with PIN domain